MKNILALIITSSVTSFAIAQVQYPLPLNEFPVEIEGQKCIMRYMDSKPGNPNGESVLLLHGKNFNGYYWKDMISPLTSAGYRVIMPDQLGWGRSDKPNIHYSFHLLASINKLLLDSLGIKKVNVVGHSMGGMLATRFALMFPSTTGKLVLENPIGLEDYKTFVPYRSLEKLTENERKATYETYKKYQQSYYPEWKNEYEQYVKAQAEQLLDPDFKNIAFVNALTYQMIYEQPVVYEFSNLDVSVLIIIGLEDRTIVGKDQLLPAQVARYGQYPLLGKLTAKRIPKSTLVEMKEVGHIPHIQAPQEYLRQLLKFLKG